jgi:DNA invertase Pin-like site-specific DNA recombinase
MTRSLADFAKIVEVLDAAGASFVSVTQAFNTTTSMGRLRVGPEMRVGRGARASFLLSLLQAEEDAYATS